MRCYKRVVQTAAPLRDRPAGEVKSATRARRQRIPSSAYATPCRLVARTPQSQSEMRADLCRARPSFRPVSDTSSFSTVFAFHLPPASRTGRCTTGESHEHTRM